MFTNTTEYIQKDSYVVFKALNTYSKPPEELDFQTGLKSPRPLEEGRGRRNRYHTIRAQVSIPHN